MIHTAELIKEISEEEYKYILSLVEKFEYRNNKAHIYALAEYGITDIEINRYVAQNSPTITYYCKAIINLARLSNDGKQEYRLFTDITDTEKLYKYFKKYIGVYLPYSSDLSEWRTRRIDYTVDIRTPLVEAHIRALQRGRKPPTMKIPDNNQHKQERNRRHFKGSVRYHNKSTIINIYDKYFERECKQRERQYTDIEELVKSQDILRIEVQCLKSKTNYIKAKKRFEGKEIKHYLSQYAEIKNIVLRAYTQIAGHANYYSYNRAKELIEQSAINKRTRAIMTDVLALINGNRGTRSVWKAELKYNELYPNEIAFKTILKHFEEIGVNPVTLPKDVEFLPNLGEEITKYFDTLKKSTRT